MSAQVEITDGLSVSLSTLAREFGMARETCKKRLQQAGVVPSGKHKTHDVFRIGAAARAILAPEIDAAKEDDPEKMSPKDRLDWYRGARERTKHLQELGELVSVSDYEKALSSALKKVAIALETIPDQIEREAPISGEAIEVIQRITDRVRETVYRGLSAGDG